MRRRRILVIEDDPSIREGLVDALSFSGYRTVQAERGDTGLDKALRAPCDLVLLDLVLPGADGLEVLRQLREARPTLPVIILTARGEESDRVRGLKDGADDYVVKPFGVSELLARVEAVLRRSAERPQDVRRVDVPGGVVDLDRREVRFDDGESHELSEREAELLRYLAAHCERAVSRDELLLRVWGLDPRVVETRTVDVHVARLREKLRDASSTSRVIRTVRGKGYSLRSDRSTA
jgi:two-component system alkaline phosphatase synthesis response regulator PhoP